MNDLLESLFGGGSTSTIIGIFLVLAFFYIIIRIFRIVPETERLVIQRLGTKAGVRGPGPVFVFPILESATRVDIREKFLEIPRQTAISKDNAPINVDFLVYYRVVNPEDYIFKIDNAVRAALNIAATTLRSVIGDMPLDDVLAKRENINDVLRVKVDEATENWGIKVTRVEIREIEPPREVQDAMNRQMTAERQRRAMVTTAEGERQSSIMVAEGQKQASILKAEGDKQAEILKAEGQRQAQLLKAQGFAAGLDAIYKEAKDVDPNTMMLQYLDTLREVGMSPSTKFILPMEITSMMTQLTGIITNPNRGNGKTEDHTVAADDSVEQIP